MEPTAQGTLARTPLAHLVVYCLERKLTGSLVLLPPGAPTPTLQSPNHLGQADVIRLQDGFPTKVRIPQLVEHLGKVLLDLGLLTERVMNESVASVHRGHGLLGQILLERGALDEASLLRGLRAQQLRKLSMVFDRPDATTYAFYDGVDVLAQYGGEGTPVDPLPLVLSAVRSRPSPSHLEAALAKVAQVKIRLRPTSDLSRFDLSRPERALCEPLREEPRTVDELLQARILDANHTRVLVYGLLLVKQLEVANNRATSLSNRPPASTTAAHSTTTARASFPPPAKSETRFETPMSTRMSVALPQATSPSRPPPHAPPTSGRILTPGRPLPAVVKPPASSPIGLDSLVTADPSRVQEIRTRAAKIADENYFEMLGVGRDATADDVRNVYAQLAKRWHPDRLSPDLDALRSHVELVFRHLTEAFATLSNPDKRKNYLRLLAEGSGTAREQAEVARVVEAEQHFRKAMFFMGKGAFDEAEPFVQQAYELVPDDPEHIAVWCWLAAQKPERRAAGRCDDLLERMTNALTKSPNSERIRFYRAMLLKQVGRIDDAFREFKAVAEANPRNIDAVREVRLHHMRLEKEKARKDEGLLGKLIPRKK